MGADRAVMEQIQASSNLGTRIWTIKEGYCLPAGEVLQPAEQLKCNHCDTFCVQTGVKMSREKDGTLRWKLGIRIVDQQNDGVLRQRIKLHRQIIGDLEIRLVAVDAFASHF